MGHLPCSVAVGEQCPDGHHPSRRPQALRQPRDDDRVPTMVSENIVPPQRAVEHVPADRQHFRRARFQLRIGVGRLGVAGLFVLSPGR